MFTAEVNMKLKSLTLTIGIAILAVIFFAVLFPGLIGADNSWAWDGSKKQNGKLPKACTYTAAAAFKACLNETQDDYWIAKGNCANISDPEERAECYAVAKEEYHETAELCMDQKEARLDLCYELGEDRYDPQIDPTGFVDFNSVIDGGPFSPNPYFPLLPGTTWIYKTKDAEGEVVERIKVEVLEETKEILGVNCIVVRDRVWEIEENDEGERERSLIEDTFDWYAQDNYGNVWYFGEISRSYEDGELTELEGSWKAGKDFAKIGIIMWSYPEGSDSEPEQYVYRQEFHLGNAEDIGEFVEFVDSKTVRGLTYDNVLVTRDYTPIEPEGFEYKYYAPGVGLILEEGFEDDEPTGEQVELVNKMP